MCHKQQGTTPWVHPGADREAHLAHPLLMLNLVPDTLRPQVRLGVVWGQVCWVWGLVPRRGLAAVCRPP